MWHKMVRILGSFCVFILLLACSQSPPEPIKVGLAINLSGRGGAAGEHIRDGAILAVDEVNKGGGINGRPLILLVRDDENSDEGVKKADQSLIDEGVVAIFGHSYSSNTLTSHPIVTSQNIVLITGYAATNKLTGLDDLFLRTSVDCTLYGKKTAQLLEKKRVAKVSVLLDMSNPSFVLDYVEHLKKNFTGAVTEVSFESRENANWQHLIDELLHPSPDAVLLLTEASMTGVAVQKLRADGFAGSLIGTIWTQTPGLFDYGGKAAEGMSLVTFISPENNRPEYLYFVEKMDKKFKRQATARSTRAYELIMILSDALRRCETLSGDELKKQLLAKKYETLMGEVEFDQYGDVVRPVYEVVVRQGKFQTRGEI